jgi:uncharacterized protein
MTARAAPSDNGGTTDRRKDMVMAGQHEQPGSPGSGAARPGREPAGNPWFAGLGEATYMSLTTFKRDGTPVATPVHVVVVDGRPCFRTWEPSGKWKRLRHTQRVLAAPATARGRVTAPPVPATARLLSGPDAARVARALARRHAVLHGLLIPVAHRVRGWRTVHYELLPGA